MDKKKIKIYCVVALLYTLLMAIIFSTKVNYHVDELLSFNLSNGRGWFQPELGVTYEPADEPFIYYMGNRNNINYKLVWFRQELDVHPPVYYVFFQTICRLFPKTINMWLGGVLNFIFQLISLFFTAKLVDRLVDNKKAKASIIVAYIFCAGILNITTFIRMYTLVIMWVTIVTYLLITRDEKYKIRDLIYLYAVSVCGALTHYYFIAYLVIICVVIGINWIIKKRYIELVKLTVSMCLAGLSSYLIFPAMIDHVFNSYRGEEVLGNLSKTDFRERFWQFAKIVDGDLFGNLLLVFLILGIIYTVFLLVEKKQIDLAKKIKTSKGRDFIVLSCVSVLFFLFVSKSAVYVIDRYISPFYGILFVTVTSGLFYALKVVFEDEKIRIAVFAIILAVMSCNGLRSNNWEYLQLHSTDKIKYAKENAGDKDAVIVFGEYWELVSSYEEISKCKSATYYLAHTYEELNEYGDVFADKDDIVLFLVGDNYDGFIEQFEEANPNYVLQKCNGSFGSDTSYYYTKAE